MRALILVTLVALAAAAPARADGDGPSPTTAPATTDTGWAGEPLPAGLRRKLDGPAPAHDRVYVWKRPGDPAAIAIEMVYVPPGDFTMGSKDGEGDADEHPQHRHAMPRGYYIGRYDVTVAQFARFVAATRYGTDAERDGWAYSPTSGAYVKAEGASWRDPGFAQGPDHPVVCVTWKDASAFCAWAGLALPTEAQWEKAARWDPMTGRSFAYPWGDAWEPRWANFLDRSCPIQAGDKDDRHSDGFPFTSPVGAFPNGASPSGALDMCGDVWQWCRGGYDDEAYARFAKGDFTESDKEPRVVRGGSWWFRAKDCRSASRGTYKPEDRDNQAGFRVCLEAGG